MKVLFACNTHVTANNDLPMARQFGQRPCLSATGIGHILLWGLCGCRCTLLACLTRHGDLSVDRKPYPSFPHDNLHTPDDSATLNQLIPYNLLVLPWLRLGPSRSCERRGGREGDGNRGGASAGGQSQTHKVTDEIIRLSQHHKMLEILLEEVEGNTICCSSAFPGSSLQFSQCFCTHATTAAPPPSPRKSSAGDGECMNRQFTFPFAFFWLYCTNPPIIWSGTLTKGSNSRRKRDGFDLDRLLLCLSSQTVRGLCVDSGQRQFFSPSLSIERVCGQLCSRDDGGKMHLKLCDTDPGASSS